MFPRLKRCLIRSYITVRVETTFEKKCKSIKRKSKVVQRYIGYENGVVPESCSSDSKLIQENDSNCLISDFVIQIINGSDFNNTCLACKVLLCSFYACLPELHVYLMLVLFGKFSSVRALKSSNMWSIDVMLCKHYFFTTV